MADSSFRWDPKTERKGGNGEICVLGNVAAFFFPRLSRIRRHDMACHRIFMK